MPFVFTLDGRVVRQEPTRRITRGTQTREVRCREQLEHYVVPITPRLYTVVCRVPRNTVAELGIYRSTEDWHTSFFYINSVGVNYWITLARFMNKLKKWNRDKKTGKQEGYTRIPTPRPETAIWIEDADRPGGVFFGNFLSNVCL